MGEKGEKTMYCGKCGSFNQDGMAFCQNCGSPLNGQPTPQQNPSPQQPPKKKKTGLIIGLCVAIAAVITGLVFLGIWFFGDNGPLGGGESRGDSDRDSKSGFASAEAVPKAYVEAMTGGDADEVMALYPKKVLDACLEGEGLTKKEFRKELQDSIDDILDDFDDEFGHDWSVSAEDIEVDSVKKSALEELQELYDSLDLEVTDAAEVSYTMVVNFKNEDGDKDTDDNGETRQTVVKIGGRWFLHTPRFWNSINISDDGDERPSRPSEDGFTTEGDAVAAAIRAVYVDADAEALLALIPDEVLDLFLDYCDVTEKELKKGVQNLLDELREEVEDEYGRDCLVSVMVEPDRDWEPSTIEIQELQEFYEPLGEITDMANVYFLAYVNYQDRQVSDDNFFAVEIDGHWYPECLELLAQIVWELTDG